MEEFTTTKLYGFLEHILSIPVTSVIVFTATVSYCKTTKQKNLSGIWQVYIPCVFVGKWMSSMLQVSGSIEFTSLLCLSTDPHHMDSFWGPGSKLVSSVTQSCPTLCDPMNRSRPGLPVQHQLPEFTQTHVHWVGDAIQPSHSLSSPSPPAPNPSQHQCLFQWVNTLHEVAKVLEFQL